MILKNINFYGALVINWFTVFMLHVTLFRFMLAFFERFTINVISMKDCTTSFHSRPFKEISRIHANYLRKCIPLESLHIYPDIARILRESFIICLVQTESGSIPYNIIQWYLEVKLMGSMHFNSELKKTSVKKD